MTTLVLLTLLASPVIQKSFAPQILSGKVRISGSVGVRGSDPEPSVTQSNCQELSAELWAQMGYDKPFDQNPEDTQIEDACRPNAPGPLKTR